MGNSPKNQIEARCTQQHGLSTLSVEAQKNFIGYLNEHEPLDVQVCPPPFRRWAHYYNLGATAAIALLDRRGRLRCTIIAR